MFDRGVCIGKFYPPHRGHSLLIETALDACRNLTVIVCERPEDTIPGRLRAAWLAELHPTADVRVIDDRYDEKDSRVWAENTIRWLGSPPDAVFTSEEYGPRYAALMGAQHVMVDPARERVACRASEIRRDPYRHWQCLTPPVRAWYAKRVCVLGAESTGTTTLAAALAQRLHTSWVEEYGREYTYEKLARGESEWRAEEFAWIACEQQRRENDAARQANRVVICDTNAFATVLWQRRYLGAPTQDVVEIANRDRCDLYLLTGDEIPFVQDGIRDGEAIRHAMHGWFEETLRSQDAPWLLLRGSHEERMTASLAAIKELFADSAWSAV